LDSLSLSDLWLFLAGAVATSVNAAAGGGTLLSFPSLLAGGLTPLTANATSTVALLPGQITSLWAYRREIAAARSDAVMVAGPGLVGGAIGAGLLIWLGNGVFTRVVPVFLVTAASLLVAQPFVTKWLTRRTAAATAAAAAAAKGPGAGAPPAGDGGASSLPARPRSLAPAILATLGVAIYFGYFGAGGGIMFLAAMGFMLSWRPFSQVNALKVEVASLSNLVAASVFVGGELLHPRGSVAWRAALPLALGGVVGGYFAVGFVRKLPPTVLRSIAAAVGVGIALYLTLR
jgi:uncharacterized membrane protein YfcA